MGYPMALGISALPLLRDGERRGELDLPDEEGRTGTPESNPDLMATSVNWPQPHNDTYKAVEARPGAFVQGTSVQLFIFFQTSKAKKTCVK